MAGSSDRPPVNSGLTDGGGDPTRREAAEYISSLLEGLRQVAHQAELPFLGYLIGIALEEANSEKARRD